MQKQPSLKYPVEYTPYSFTEDFPVSSLEGEPYVLNEDEITSLHIHDCLEIGVCYEGAGIFIVNEKILPFSGGETCVIFRNQLHKAQSEKGKRSKWDFVYINVEQLFGDMNAKDLSCIHNLLTGGYDFNNILKPNQQPDINKLIVDIITEIRNANTSYKVAVKGLILALIAKLGRLFKDPTGEENNTGNDIIRILPAIDYISKNYMEPIQIAKVASLCNMSLTNLRRYFNHCLRVSPLEYITKIRIQTAAMLLISTKYSILDISTRVGYCSLSSFNRHFKEFQGVCPRNWRNSNNSYVQ